jgi:hypothetical protein
MRPPKNPQVSPEVVAARRAKIIVWLALKKSSLAAASFAVWFVASNAPASGELESLI